MKYETIKIEDVTEAVENGEKVFCIDKAEGIFSVNDMTMTEWCDYCVCAEKTADENRIEWFKEVR